MKLLKSFFKFFSLLAGLMLFIASAANATTYFSFGNNDPGVLANWWTVNNGTGTHPASFATAADVFTIQNANTYTTTGTWTIAGSVTVSTGGALVIASGNAVTIPTLTVTGTGLVTNNGNLTVATNLTGTGGLTNAATGTFNYGATTIGITTFTFSAAGNTVNYNKAGAQTVKTGTYSNLTVSGSGAKTTTTVTVNGIMTMGGTATVLTVPTYGAASTLYYDGTAAQTTSTEFPASFTGSGGVVSNNALGVTMNAIKSVSKLTVNSGASFSTGATNTWTLTVTGITSVSGTLTLSNNATKTFTGTVTVNNGGTLTIPSTAVTVNMSSDLTVASGGILNDNASYNAVSANTTYLQIDGNLSINGTYNYGANTPAVWMNGTGTLNINTGTTALWILLLRQANYYANGPVTVNQDFYAMWNQVGGSFHTNGQTVNANWGLVNNGGTVYVDGGSLNVGSTVGGMLVGRTLTQDGDLQVSSGTLTISGGGIYLGTPASATPKGTCTQSGGTINVAILDLGQNCTYTQSGGINNVNGSLNLNYSSSTYSQTTGTPTLNIAGNLTNNGVLSTGAGTDLINIQGNWINNLTFTTSSTNTVTFNGAGGQDIGGSVSSTFNNLTINDAGGVTTSKDQTVNSTLNLTAGKFNIGANNLILGSAAVPVVAGSAFSPTNMIVADGGGEVRKNFSGTGSYLYPVGDNTGTAEYSPVTLNFTSGTFAGGAYAGVKVTNAKHPNNSSTTDYLTRYWTLSNSGITTPSFTATATYLTADITGTEANIAGAKYTGSLPWVKYGVIGSHTLTTTAITNTGAGIIVTGITNLPPTVSITGGGVTICPGSTTASLSSTVVNATGSISYSWTPTTGLSSSTISNPVANPASTTTYTLTVTDGDGFTGTAMTTITVGSIPGTPTISAGGPLTFCTGGSVTLTSSAGSTYLWSTGATTSSISPTISGSYSVQVTNASGCQSAPSAATVVTVTANNTAGAPSSTPTLCINTALTSITIATTGATAISSDGVAGANGLPAGVSAHWAANTITISGTPAASGTFNYSIALTGGCGAVNATGTITVTANNTAGAPSSTPTLCINTALTSITIATTGATAISNDNVAGANGLPAGVSAHWAANTITISGTPTAAGTFNYSIALTGGCGAVNATGTITVTANNTAGAPSSTPTLCINTALTNITIATTGATAISNDNVAGANGLPAGVKAHWVANVITISGTPTAAGTFNYSIALTGGCGAVNATGTITVTANNTAGAPSSTPTLCINTALTSITIATTGATAISNDNVAGANGLPAGVSAHWAANTITISGTPTAAGTFNYSIALTGGCGAINATGTITVTPANTAGAPSSTPTLCINTALTNITIATTGATAISNDNVAGANGLPAGVKAHWVANVITISGTPTAAGTFNYSIALTGGCGAVNATGTITVTANNTAGAPSSTPTLCINTALTNITIATTGATAISNDNVAGANGLPAGVSAHWAANTITISGTPTAAGTFNYSIALTGGCGAINATGTITVTPANTAGAPSSTPTLCINTALTSITITTTGATAISNDNIAGANGLPAGVKAHWVANVITISGTPTASGTFSYSIALTGGCGSVNATGTITVTANNTAGAPSSTPTLCINTALTSITIATTGATAISSDGVAGANGLPAGVSAHWAANTITISGTPTAAGTFNYSIALTGGCGAVNATGTITVTANNTAGAPSSTPTLCINTALTNITIATTGATAISNDNVAGANGLPAGVKAHWVANVITISGTPTASGTFNYSIALTGGCGAVNATGTITVTANNIAGAPSSTPTLCINTALTSITIATTGATAISNDNVAGANGLPAGVSAHWAANTITISGTPTAAGTFNYSIALTGGCGAINAIGTITVTANNTAGAPSSTPTLCINTALTSITIATTGATAISNDGVAGANGLPAGVSAHWAANTITISGTPTASGTFNYSIALTGGCGAINATGTITVTPANTAGAPSSTPTLCINTALTSITITTTGATAISNDGVAGANGLPAGVSAHWAANTITISGTPAASGTFNYSIALTGGCGSINATGTITINPVSIGGTVSGSAAVCSGTNSGTLTLSGQTGSVVRWEYSTDGGTTWTTIVNTTTSQTYTNLTVATLYRAVVQSGVCASANSASAGMTITTPPSATISYAGSPFCSNTGVAPVTFSGSTGGTYSISPAGGVINPATGTVDLAASSPGLYTITYTITAFGGCSTYTTTASIVINPNTWIGAISTDWNTPGNWAANAVPTLSCPDVTILSGVPYQPTLGSGTFAIQNLYINTGAYLTINNATLQISGAINNSGTFDVSNGAIELNGGSAQTIPAGAFLNNALYDLIISNTSVSGVSLGGAVDIYHSLNYSGTGMTLATNDNLTFKSIATNTAWLGDMTGNTITGKATVERYISSRKAWRFLSIPTNTTQTTRQTWQEGATTTGSNPVPGYGIQLSGAGGTAAGFDLYSALPSMKTYNSSTAVWVGVPNTNVAGIKATDGYMVFIRGDRTVNSISAAPTQTTLRTKGTLYIGNQTPIVVSAGKFAAIGNPYPSTIDMRNITKTGVKDFFYVWDAALAGAYGYGAYQTFSNNGSGNYVITPGGGSYGASGSISNYIQSGQAFFVQGDVGGGSLTFKEAAKTTGSGVVSIASVIPTPQMRANLYGVNADNTTYMTDGLLVNYNDNYSNNVDDLDAIKQTNTSENLSVKTANQLLVIERRHTITDKDTVFLNLTGVSVRKYRFEFLADQLYNPGLTAFLLDNYLHTSTPLYIDGTTDVDFSVTSAAGSKAANRFMIVFSQLGALPVTFTSVKAYSQDKNINVEWSVDNEMNMKQYETEKSTDGNGFTTLSVTAATANGGHSASYLITDIHPVQGYNYYRIKSVGLNGKIAYTSIVKVMIGSFKQDISVYPNPVVNGIINLQLNNQPQGRYGIRLLNKSGQVIMKRQVEHADGSSTETISLDKYAPRGIYQLEVTKTDGTKSNINVVY